MGLSPSELRKKQNQARAASLAAAEREIDDWLTRNWTGGQVEVRVSEFLTGADVGELWLRFAGWDMVLVDGGWETHRNESCGWSLIRMTPNE